MKKLLLKILQFIKYRNIKLLKEGENCIWKSLSSNFIYSQNISLGDNVNIGKGADFDGWGGIYIGNGVIFAPEVCIYSRTHNFNSDDLKALPFDDRMISKSVIIKDYVWIGRRVIILPGVTIGKGAVIGAGAVVTKNIPDYAIAVGNPAVVKKYRNKMIFNELYDKNIFVYDIFGHKKIVKKIT